MLLGFAAGAAAESPTDPLSAESLIADVRRYAALAPDHLTGTTDSATTERWIAEQLHAAGLGTGADAYSTPSLHSPAGDAEHRGVPLRSVVARFYSGTKWP
jgi:hypothetical protein